MIHLYFIVCATLYSNKFFFFFNFLLGALEMNSLEVRRTRLEIVTATKILQGHIDSPEYVERLSRLYVPNN
jgi:hypothetical protein